MSPQLLRKPLYYDAARRRLWIFGQRCHHGATGALMAGAGVAVGAPVLLATGTVLMAHDRHDWKIWFQRGWQNQP